MRALCKRLFFLPVVLFFVFNLSCRSKRAVSPVEDVPNASKESSFIEGTKVDGKKLSLTDSKTSVENVFIGQGDNKGILVASEGSPGTEYIEYVLCKKNEDWCSDVHTFVRYQGLITDAPKGDYIVKMRACVDPYNATNPKENCGPWKEQLVSQSTDNTKLGALLNDYKKVVSELKIKCLMLHKRAREDFVKPGTAPEDKEFAAKLAQYFTPEICASFAEAQDAAVMIAEIEKQQAIAEKGKETIQNLSVGLMVAGALVGITGGILWKKLQAPPVVVSSPSPTNWKRITGWAAVFGSTAFIGTGAIILGYQKYQERKSKSLELSSGSSSNLMEDYAPMIDEIMALGKKARDSYQIAFSKF